MLHVFPDVELWACQALREQLEGRTEAWATGMLVDIRVPPARPDRFVVIQADPGPTDTFKAQVNLRVRNWAPTEQEAAETAALLRALLFAAADGRDGISRLPGGGLPAWLTDESDQPARVQWIPLLVRAHDKE